MLTGWKQITGYAGLSRPTILKLVLLHRFPVKWVGIKPISTELAVDMWFETYEGKKGE